MKIEQELARARTEFESKANDIEKKYEALSADTVKSINWLKESPQPDDPEYVAELSSLESELAILMSSKQKELDAAKEQYKAAVDKIRQQYAN